MTYDEEMESRAMHDDADISAEPNWDPELCTCEKDGEQCQYCIEFIENLMDPTLSEEIEEE
jgi:hypothetical protein